MATDQLLKAVIKDPQHNRRVQESLQILYMRRDFTDLRIICARGIAVYAHKLLLCTVSTHLKDIFAEMPDSTDTITMHMPDIEAQLLNLLLDFLYKGAVRVNKNEYTDFQALMDLLGVVLATPSGDSNTRTASQTQQVPFPPPLQAAQVVYVQAPPNNQGQPIQYVIGPAQLPQGQVMQGPLMSPVVQSSMAQPTAQPVIMTQSSGQMVQAGTQVVSAQVQPNNMMQIVPQNSSQVVSMAGQIVGGTPMVQCQNPIVVQNNQQGLMNNNQMQNQVVQSSQQRGQYVMSTPANQMTASRGRTQYNQPQTQPQQVTRTRNTPQQQQPQQTRPLTNRGEITTELVRAALEQHKNNLESLTAHQLRVSLEEMTGRDLSNNEKWIEQVLSEVLGRENGNSTDQVNDRNEPSTSTKQTRNKRKKRIAFSRSDDEGDEDFDPKKTIVSRRGRRRKQ